MKRKLILGTRGSALALAQSRAAAVAIREKCDVEIEEKIIHTTGDRRLDLSLIDAPGTSIDKGLFTKELEFALLSGEIDFAVHSLKDLPTQLPTELTLGAILEREDAGDVAVLRDQASLALLPGGAVIGTSSVRRRSQLREKFSNFEFKEIRGNVPTRLEKLMNGDFDAIVLAVAGLKRLGHAVDSSISMGAIQLRLERLDWMLPAPGQGAVALECRESDANLREMLKKVHHPETALVVETERRVLSAMGGGCQLALGTLARVLSEGEIELEAVWYSEDAEPGRRFRFVGTEPAAVATRTAIELMRVVN